MLRTDFPQAATGLTYRQGQVNATPPAPRSPMSPVDDVSTGELARRLNDVQQTVHGFDEKLERGLHGFDEKLERGYVRTETLQQIVGPLERRVSSVEGQLTWAARLVLGAVILALVALVITQVGPGATV
jgi:hypothetical protein